MILLIGIVAAEVADSFANAAGMYVSEEIETYHEKTEVLKSRLYCFLLL